MKNKPFVVKSLFIVCIVLCASPLVSAPFALVGGFLFTHFWGHPFPGLHAKATSLLLKISVVGLGFGMNIHTALQTGKEGFWLTVCSITTVLVLGTLIGKWFKVDRKLRHLISCGTAICGGSAIAAIAPAIKAPEKEISVSLGVVFLLNSIALLLFPILGHALGLSQHEFGMWSAIAIHDTSSVVGAASAYGEEALQIATTVKLARALWIIPLSVFYVFLFRTKGTKISLPLFILFFIVAMVLNSYIPAIHPATPYIVSASKACLVVTLFLIGSSLSVAKIKSVGWKPLLLGVLIWFAISVLSLIAILYWQ